MPLPHLTGGPAKHSPAKIVQRFQGNPKSNLQVGGKSTVSHYIYVLSRPNGWHKVGRAASPAMRMCVIQSQIREPLSVVTQHTVPKTSSKRIEERAHTLLRDCREELEWFSCNLMTANNAISQAIAAENAQVERVLSKDAVHARFIEAMNTLRWSAGHLAVMLDCHRNLPAFWVRGLSAVPPSVVEWLFDLASYQASHPAPTGWRRNQHPPFKRPEGRHA